MKTPKYTSVAGFDPGRKYIAWAVVTEYNQGEWSLSRHGLIYPPPLGNTKSFGHTTRMWSYMFDVFMEYDLDVSAFGIERFVYTPGGRGSGSEDINLRLPGMSRVGSHLIRNVDWKVWFKKNVNSEGAYEHFGTPTPHEADAAGIALYTACVKSTHATT